MQKIANNSPPIVPSQVIAGAAILLLTTELLLLVFLVLAVGPFPQSIKNGYLTIGALYQGHGDTTINLNNGALGLLILALLSSIFLIIFGRKQRKTYLRLARWLAIATILLTIGYFIYFYMTVDLSFDKLQF